MKIHICRVYYCIGKLNESKMQRDLKYSDINSVNCIIKLIILLVN